jgi:Zn-dependent protease with chaperone function
LRWIAARFNDGRTAASHEVRILVHEEGLRIERADGTALDDWPYDEIEPLDAPDSAGEVRLTRKGGEARLTVSKQAAREFLPGDPAPTIRTMGRWNRWRRMLGLAAAIVVAAGAVWLFFPTGVRLAASVIPVAWEEALGDWAFDKAVAAFGLSDGAGPSWCEGAGGRAALDGLTARLAAAGDAPYRFQVGVVDRGRANAFALPGGRIVIFKGLLDFAEGPDELSAVLAHEMAHVTHRHGTQGIFRAMALDLLLESLLGGTDGGLAGDVGGVLIGLSYSREAEAQADVTAIALLRAADLRADGLGRFFARMSLRDGETPEAFSLLSTHPTSKMRAVLAREAGDAGETALSEEDWQALRTICGE